MHYPVKPTKPEEWAVIFWCGIIFLVVVGIVAFCLSFGAAFEKAHMVRPLRLLGVCAWSMAAIAYGARRIIRRFLD